MYTAIHDQKTARFIGTSFFCHGCGEWSKRRVKGMPPGWVERTESRYSVKGNLRKGTGLVVNYYCPGCAGAGCSARTDAAAIKKRLRQEVRVGT